MLKKHGNESSKVEEEEKAEHDFFTAAHTTVAMLEQFHRDGLNPGAAIGGSLTQILTYLIDVSPDSASAMALLSSCLSNAAYQTETQDLIPCPEETSIH
jgi:hypothetical protein